MALFATAEEKELKKKEKEEKEFQKLVDRYHLKDMDKEDYQLLRNASGYLVAHGIAEIGLLAGGSLEDKLKIEKLGALQEQNWIIINQLLKLNRNIEKLIENKDKQ